MGSRRGVRHQCWAPQSQLLAAPHNTRVACAYRTATGLRTRRGERRAARAGDFRGAVVRAGASSLAGASTLVVATALGVAPMAQGGGAGSLERSSETLKCLRPEGGGVSVAAAQVSVAAARRGRQERGGDALGEGGHGAEHHEDRGQLHQQLLLLLRTLTTAAHRLLQIARRAPGE